MGSKRETQGLGITFCYHCRKNAYNSRELAEDVIARHQKERPEVTEGLNTYRCPMLRDFWHLGHVPQRLRKFHQD